MTGVPLAERLWSRIDRRGPDECWPWLGALCEGYGVIWLGEGRRQLRTHRVAWTLTNGPIPDGLVLDHLCRNRTCCNPAHLEPVTFVENILRGQGAPAINAAKTECVRGHPFDPANTYITARGHRSCRQCQRIYQKAWMRQRRANS